MGLVVLTLACGKVYEPEPEPRIVEIPAGAVVAVTPTTALDTPDLKADDTFEGTLAEPIVIEETIIAPIGSPVLGRIVQNPDVGGEDVVPFGVELTQVIIHGGEEVALKTSTIFPQEKPEGEGAEIPDAAVLSFRLNEPAEFSWSVDLEELPRSANGGM